VALRDILVAFNVTVDQSQIKSTQQNVDGLMRQFRMLQRVATLALGALGINSIVESADEYTRLENRLRATTKTAEEFATAQARVFEIARNTATPVQDVTEQFQRYTMATEQLGVSQDKVLTFTENLNKATQLGGATAAETRGALIQLAQGLGTDFKAAGQEIRSIQKGAPLLAGIIAKAAGGSAGELTLLAKAGKLSTEMVFNAVVEAGAQIDAEFAKRKLSFEQIGTLLGVEWMALMKDLEPTFGKLKLVLVDVVKWIREYVKDGSAMNSFIAAAITAVATLTFMFGGLAAQAALALAPIAALYLLIQDFVTFMNGGDSVLGDLLGDNAEGFKEGLKGLSDALGGWLKAFSGDNDAAAQTFADLFASRFKTAMQAAVDAVFQYAIEKMRDITGTKVVGPQARAVDPTTGEVTGVEKMNPILDWMMGGDEERKRLIESRIANGWTPEQAGGEPAMPSTTPTPWAPVTSTGAGQYGPPPPPQITNNVTVQGNADASVARDVATKTGTATAQALGRDRSAIGAPFGASQ
jgi:tape measure domain-containing protein